MTALEVIATFVQVSGRYDLVDTDDVPTALAYYYLNSAHRWLDHELGLTSQEAMLYKTLSAGETHVEFSRCRFIKNICDADDTTEAPLDWSLVPFERAETLHVPDAEDTHWPTRIIKLEEGSTDRNLKIRATWHSPTFSSAEGSPTVSFWTVEAEDLVVNAMSLRTEISMRNSSGVADFYEPLRYDVQKIRNDMIAEELAGPPEIWRM